jgi:hypothetical protein
MRLFSVGEVTLSKDDPLSVDLTMVPDRPTATKVLFAKVTPKRLFEVGEVALSQDDPLSVDLTMFPDRPTATKVLFPKVTPMRSFEVGEVALSQDDPLSVDLTMVPEKPTATNTPEPEELSDVVVVVVVELSVLAVLLSSDFAHEETITAMLTIRTNQ